jgi:serine protease Do
VQADELGLSVQDITPEIARELDLERDSAGVVVSSVAPGSAAEEAGLRPGDIIEMVGNKPVANVAEFRKRIAERAEGESVLVLVRRGDQTLFRVIKPAPKG